MNQPLSIKKRVRIEQRAWGGGVRFGKKCRNNSLMPSTSKLEKKKKRVFREKKRQHRGINSRRCVARGHFPLQKSSKTQVRDWKVVPQGEMTQETWGQKTKGIQAGAEKRANFSAERGGEVGFFVDGKKLP